MIIEELIALLGFDLTGEEKLSRFVRGLDMATRGLAAFAARAAAFAAGAAVAIGGGLALLGKGAIETGAQFEDLLAVLTVVEGSSDKAKASLDWVEQFATKTPYDLKTVADAFVSLKAYGLDPMPGLLESIGNAASAMNKPLQQGVEAIADAVRGENERLKEFGIVGKKAGEQFTYTWTQNGKEMTKTVKNNAIEIQKALQEIFDARFLGAMDARSKTFNGIVANIGDMWTKFLRMIADAGVFDWVKDQFQAFLDGLNELADNGTLEAIAKTVSDTLVMAGAAVKDLLKSVTLQDVVQFLSGAVQFLLGVGKIVGSLITAIGTIGKFIASLLGLKDTWKGVLIALGAVAALVAPWAAAFAALLLIVDDFIAWLQGRPSLIGEALKGITAVFDSWAPTVKAAWQSVVDALSATGFGQFISGLVDQLKTFDLGQYFSGWGATVDGLVDSFQKLGTAIADIGKSLFGLSRDSGAGDVFGTIAAGLGKLGGQQITAGLEALKGVVTVIADALKGMLDTFTALAKGDFLGAFKTWQDTLLQVAADVKNAIEKIIQAFLPDFSFMESWNAITAFFDGIADKVAAFADRVVGLMDRVKNAFNFSGSGPVFTPPAEGIESKSMKDWLGDWWKGGGDQPAAADPQQSGAADSETFKNALDSLSALSRFGQQTGSLNAGGAGPLGETVANDNRVTNTTSTVNAPVTINATTNATAGEIGAAAGSSVRDAGQKVGRDLAVVSNPGAFAR